MRTRVRICNSWVRRGPHELLGHSGIAWVIRATLTEAAIDTRRRGAHAFRHGYASAVLRESGNPVVVQKLLGHASLLTTMAYVVDHLALADLRAALPGYVPNAAPAPRPTFAPPCPPPVRPQPTLTAAEAASMLGVGSRQVLYLWRRGNLEGRKVSGVLRLDPLSVAALLAERLGQRTPTPSNRRV